MYEISNFKIVDLLPTNYFYQTKLTIKNTGQWIIAENNLNKDLGFEKGKNNLKIQLFQLKKEQLVKPGQKETFNLQIETGSHSREAHFKLANKDYTLYIYKPFDWHNKKVSLWQQINNRLKLWWLGFREK